MDDLSLFCEFSEKTNAKATSRASAIAVLANRFMLSLLPDRSVGRFAD
jgi:hypothetical protein